MGRRWQIRRWLHKLMHVAGRSGRRKQPLEPAKAGATRPAVRSMVLKVQSDVDSPVPERNAGGNIVFRDFFGLRLAFADRILKKLDVPDGEPYLFIGDPRKLFDAPDPRRCLLDHYGIDSVTDTIIGMTSAQGGWYRAVARLKLLGVQSFVIMLDPQRNERMVAKRVAIPIKTIRTMFIPNYKCGYASFRAFCFDNFSEFKDCDPDRSASLNKVVDFSQCWVNSYFKFSTIRHPVTRFRSLYFDKFCRVNDHVSYNAFLLPFRSLLEKDELTPCNVIKVISEIPDEFSDAHWKSQHFNTTHDGCTLVDCYVRLEHMEEDLEEVSRRVSFRFALPKVLSTATIARNHEHRSHFEQEIIREKLARRYPDDFLRLGYA